MTTQYQFYAPLRSAPSMRTAVFGAEPTLAAAGADSSTSSSSSGSDDSSVSTLPSHTVTSLLIALLVIGLISLPFHRVIPPSLAKSTDQFSMSHHLQAGESLTIAKQPTHDQFGGA